MIDHEALDLAKAVVGRYSVAEYLLYHDAPQAEIDAADSAWLDGVEAYDEHCRIHRCGSGPDNKFVALAAQMERGGEIDRAIQSYQQEGRLP